MLECANLTKSYKKRCVVNNLSFRMERGEHCLPLYNWKKCVCGGDTDTCRVIIDNFRILCYLFIREQR